MRKAILYFLLFVAMNLAVGYATQLVLGMVMPEDSETKVLQLLIATGVNSVLIVSLFAALKWCPVSRDYVRSRPWGTFFWTVLLAVGMILPLAWLESLVPEWMKTDLVGDILGESLGTTEGYFVICMLAPLAEEVVFRGAIISSLVVWAKEKFGSYGITQADETHIEWLAIIISAMLFALVHFNPAQMPHALIVGVLLGWIYARTHSIVPCFLIHWINNSSAYVMLKLFPSIPMDAGIIDYFNGNTWAMYQAVISSLLIAVPAIYQLHKRM